MEFLKSPTVLLGFGLFLAFHLLSAVTRGRLSKILNYINILLHIVFLIPMMTARLTIEEAVLIYMMSIFFYTAVNALVFKLRNKKSGFAEKTVEQTSAQPTVNIIEQHRPSPIAFEDDKQICFDDTDNESVVIIPDELSGEGIIDCSEVSDIKDEPLSDSIGEKLIIDVGAESAEKAHGEPSFASHYDTELLNLTDSIINLLEQTPMPDRIDKLMYIQDRLVKLQSSWRHTEEKNNVSGSPDADMHKIKNTDIERAPESEIEIVLEPDEVQDANAAADDFKSTLSILEELILSDEQANCSSKASFDGVAHLDVGSDAEFKASDDKPDGEGGEDR